MQTLEIGKNCYVLQGLKVSIKPRHFLSISVIVVIWLKFSTQPDITYREVQLERKNLLEVLVYISWISFSSKETKLCAVKNTHIYDSVEFDDKRLTATFLSTIYTNSRYCRSDKPPIT